MRARTLGLGLAAAGLVAFLGWRFLRPLNIFVVDERFERPVDTREVPPPLQHLRAEGCAACHPAFYDEWKTTIHSQAWTDPYFQADWKFDGRQQVCRNCHTPLDRQQPQRVLGFRDKEKWDPILAPNPDFDPRLQHEGVTCAACHLREGRIQGVLGLETAPHPVRRLADPNQVCVRCHVVGGERWDTFYRFPPCGTVAEIQATPGALAKEDIDMALQGKGPADAPAPAPAAGTSGEIRVSNTKQLGCVQCHMPRVERPLVPGGPVRASRRHLWRGGHDPEMVRKALTVKLEDRPGRGGGGRLVLTLTNTGAAHYLPTGTPDRHLTAELKLLDPDGRVIEVERATFRRTVMWRPFIVDLWDTRLPRWQPRRVTLRYRRAQRARAAAAEAVVRYHLLDEKRRRRIGYENTTPIAYEVVRRRLSLGPLPAPEEERHER